MAIANTEMVSAIFRPIRSPMYPKIRPPIGRIRNPAANTPNAAIKEAAGSSDGKKWRPMMGAK